MVSRNTESINEEDMRTKSMKGVLLNNLASPKGTKNYKF